MKLYATITSERATKGQGGNEYIEIEIKDAAQRPFLILRTIPDGTLNRTTLVIDGVARGTFYTQKGEKQKGESVYVSEDSNICTTHDKNH